MYNLGLGPQNAQIGAQVAQVAQIAEIVLDPLWLMCEVGRKGAKRAYEGQAFIDFRD